MFVIKQLTVAIDFHSIFFFLLWKSMATVNCLVSNILRNIYFLVTGLEQNKGEYIFILGEQTV